MSGHSHSGRFVVAELKRRWTLDEKKAVVAESQAASTSISAVARKHGLAPALLFRWRRELGAGPSPSKKKTARTRFMPICLPAPRDAAASDDDAGPGIVEIEMRSGLRLRVEAASLNRVLDILEAR